VDGVSEIVQIPIAFGLILKLSQEMQLISSHLSESISEFVTRIFQISVLLFGRGISVCASLGRHFRIICEAAVCGPRLSVDCADSSSISGQYV
jgi:hypothetical protein